MSDSAEALAAAPDVSDLIDYHDHEAALAREDAEDELAGGEPDEDTLQIHYSAQRWHAAAVSELRRLEASVRALGEALAPFAQLAELQPRRHDDEMFACHGVRMRDVRHAHRVFTDQSEGRQP